MACVVWSSTHSMCCFVLAHYACCVKTACGECCPQPSSSMDPVLKQPVAKTTHIMCHKQHTGVLNLHPVMCIGVLYCPRCVKITHEMRYKCCFNTCSSKQHTMGTLMWVISTWLFLQCGHCCWKGHQVSAKLGSLNTIKIWKLSVIQSSS